MLRVRRCQRMKTRRRSYVDPCVKIGRKLNFSTDLSPVHGSIDGEGGEPKTNGALGVL